MSAKVNKIFLVLFSIMFLLLLYITIQASLGENVITASGSLWKDDWFKATIIDFYNNQLIIFFWIIYKEVSILKLIVFLILSICLGSYFTIAYILFQFYKYRNFKKVICETKRTLE